MCDCSSFIDLNGHSCFYLIWCLFIDFCEIFVMGHLDHFIFYMNLEFYHHNRVNWVTDSILQFGTCSLKLWWIFWNLILLLFCIVLYCIFFFFWVNFWFILTTGNNWIALSSISCFISYLVVGFQQSWFYCGPFLCFMDFGFIITTGS